MVAQPRSGLFWSHPFDPILGHLTAHTAHMYIANHKTILIVAQLYFSAHRCTDPVP